MKVGDLVYFSDSKQKFIFGEILYFILKGQDARKILGKDGVLPINMKLLPVANTYDRFIVKSKELYFAKRKRDLKFVRNGYDEKREMKPYRCVRSAISCYAESRMEAVLKICIEDYCFPYFGDPCCEPTPL
jgi:hypothetical protein